MSLFNDYVRIVLCLIFAINLIDGASMITQNPRELNCRTSLSIFSNWDGLLMITEGELTVVGGYRMDGNNKDPILIKFDSGKRSWCRYDYDINPQNSDIYGLAYSSQFSDSVWVVFGVEGQSGFPHSDLRRAASSGWLSDYGGGSQGARVSVLARINLRDGSLMKATFISGFSDSNPVPNWLLVNKLDFPAGGVSVSATSYWRPRLADGSPMSCPIPPPYSYSLNFTATLASVQHSSSGECQ
eukprot:TRINITY_DN597_c0_g1_i2.p1 TRINITY_DN597_c0_g1~~TRINITY_DN597_c0_g1_i2.p1  ORF type:complete len:242 (-),score=26.62 TRINITY_DN597_c0_g1_i2:50-775(-)